LPNIAKVPEMGNFICPLKFRVLEEAFLPTHKYAHVFRVLKLAEIFLSCLF
jgi:hypothetical protein